MLSYYSFSGDIEAAPSQALSQLSLSTSPQPHVRCLSLHQKVTRRGTPIAQLSSLAVASGGISWLWAKLHLGGSVTVSVVPSLLSA